MPTRAVPHEHRAAGSRAGDPDTARNGTGRKSLSLSLSLSLSRVLADGIQASPKRAGRRPCTQSDLETMLDMEKRSSQAVALHPVACFREAIRRFALPDRRSSRWPNRGIESAIDYHETKVRVGDAVSGAPHLLPSATPSPHALSVGFLPIRLVFELRRPTKRNSRPAYRRWQRSWHRRNGCVIARDRHRTT